MNLRDLTIDELYEVAEVGIGFRIGLRSCGQIKNGQSELVEELKTLYLLDKDELIKTIEKHASAYKEESQLR